MAYADSRSSRIYVQYTTTEGWPYGEAKCTREKCYRFMDVAGNVEFQSPCGTAAPPDQGTRAHLPTDEAMTRASEQLKIKPKKSPTICHA